MFDELTPQEWFACGGLGSPPPSVMSFYGCVRSGEGTEKECRERWLEP